MLTAADTQIFLQTLAPDFPLAVIAWDQNNRILGWNQAAENIFGYTSEQAIAHKLTDLLASDSTENIASFLAELATGQTGQLACKNRSAQAIVTHWKLLPSPVSVQQAAHNVAIIDDINTQTNRDPGSTSRSAIPVLALLQSKYTNCSVNLPRPTLQLLASTVALD